MASAVNLHRRLLLAIVRTPASNSAPCVRLASIRSVTTTSRCLSNIYSISFGEETDEMMAKHKHEKRTRTESSEHRRVEQEERAINTKSSPTDTYRNQKNEKKTGNDTNVERIERAPRKKAREGMKAEGIMKKAKKKSETKTNFPILDNRTTLDDHGALDLPNSADIIISTPRKVATKGSELVESENAKETVTMASKRLLSSKKPGQKQRAHRLPAGSSTQTAHAPKPRKRRPDATASPPSSSPLPLRSQDRAKAQSDKRFPQRKLEDWEVQKQALKQKFGETGWNPRRKLSPDAVDGIRELHEQDPERYSTPILADRFKVSPEAIRRILKGKWRPSSEKMENRRERWARRHDRIWDQQAALGFRPPRQGDRRIEGPEDFDEEVRAKQMLGQL